ncbi:hypothetical protein DUI87_25998 [Hirundo rustica rustica]|uniref:Uncharacterized protein n=1 Tax=Hirundo rustica rustica TaxID=333673 RepID=A0A3M0J8M0_HIRRU|nr:hypothetical protein DUI87_25998 [Hirundo rustica rustica]
MLMDNAEEEVVQFCHPAELGLPSSRESLGRQCWLESRGSVLFVKNYQGYGDSTGLDPIDDPRVSSSGVPSILLLDLGMMKKEGHITPKVQVPSHFQVLIVPRVLYHQEEEMYRFLEETILLRKREVMTAVTPQPPNLRVPPVLLSLRSLPVALSEPVHIHDPGISLNTLTLPERSEKVQTRHGVPSSVTGIAQTDVTQVTEFGRLKYVHVTVDTFSSVMWASAHTGEKARDVIAHWRQAFAVLGIPSAVKTDSGPAYASQQALDSEQQPRAKVRVRNLVTKQWEGPYDLIAMGRGHACVSTDTGTHWLPSKCVRPDLRPQRQNSADRQGGSRDQLESHQVDESSSVHSDDSSTDSD